MKFETVSQKINEIENSLNKLNIDCNIYNFIRNITTCEDEREDLYSSNLLSHMENIHELVCNLHTALENTKDYLRKVKE